MLAAEASRNMPKPHARIVVLVALVVLLIAGCVISVRLWQTNTKGEDIYYIWGEGQRILGGENPYARVLEGNMRDNDKYATYLPLFYELAALTQLAGLRDYQPWIAFWRLIFLLFDLGIAVVIFAALYRRRLLLAALFGAAFWLFNRWTLHVVQVAHMDFVALFLLVLSLELLDRHWIVSLLLFGASLAIKQIGVFMVPLYLLWTWQAANRDTAVKRTLIAVAAIVAIPLLASLPFLIWNAEGLIKSVLFSATRLPADHFGAPSIDGHMGWIGIPAKLPTLALMVLAYLIAWRKQAGRYISTLFVMVAFADFNSVLFRQYLVWVVPFIPLVLCDLSDRSMSIARTPADG